MLKYKTGVLNGKKVANSEIIVLSLAIIVNSLLFSLEAGMDAHIRYALPSYTIIITGLATLFFGYILREKLNRCGESDQSIHKKNMNSVKWVSFTVSDRT